MNTCILLEYTAKGEYNGIQCILPLLFSYQLTSPQSLISNIKYGKQASESTRIYLLSHNTHTINNAAKLKHVQVHLAPRARDRAQRICWCVHVRAHCRDVCACALVTSPHAINVLYVTRADRGRIGCAVKLLSCCIPGIS